MQVLASVPDLDIVAYLPLFLSSLMDCLTDPLMEVRSKAAKVLQVSSPQPAVLASKRGRICWEVYLQRAMPESCLHHDIP